MYFLVSKPADILTKPLGFVRTAIDAERIFGAPIQRIDVTLERSFVRVGVAIGACDHMLKKLEIARNKLPTHLNLSASIPTRAPTIQPKLDGRIYITLSIFVPLQRLPIGRTIKEARLDPIEYGSANQKTAYLEGHKLKLESAILPNAYKNKTTAEKKFKSLISQKTVKLVKKEDLWRPKFRYWKAPLKTFDKDRREILVRQNSPYYGKPKNPPPRELRDLFNRNVSLVEEEGSGLKMGA